MAISSKVLSYFNKNKIKYEIVKHKTVYTAYDKAATLKIKPNTIGKTLVLKTDKDLVVVLIPGNKNLDKNKLRAVVNIWKKKQGLKPAKSIDFVSETILKNKFKGIKIGALPPFGNIWKFPTFVDRGLLKEKNILVNSGIHEVSFKITPGILKKIENTQTGIFSQAKK